MLVIRIVMVMKKIILNIALSSQFAIMIKIVIAAVEAGTTKYPNRFFKIPNTVQDIDTKDAITNAVHSVNHNKYLSRKSLSILFFEIISENENMRSVDFINIINSSPIIITDKAIMSLTRL